MAEEAGRKSGTVEKLRRGKGTHRFSGRLLSASSCFVVGFVLKLGMHGQDGFFVKCTFPSCVAHLFIKSRPFFILDFPFRPASLV
jgi:hypothetical protein